MEGYVINDGADELSVVMQAALNDIVGTVSDLWRRTAVPNVTPVNLAAVVNLTLTAELAPASPSCSCECRGIFLEHLQGP